MQPDSFLDAITTLSFGRREGDEGSVIGSNGLFLRQASTKMAVMPIQAQAIIQAKIENAFVYQKSMTRIPIATSADQPSISTDDFAAFCFEPVPIAREQAAGEKHATDECRRERVASQSRCLRIFA